MTELLVLTACLYQKGCTDTASVYYASKPELQQMVFKVENRAKAMAGPLLFNYVAPVILMVAGANGAIKISSHVNLEFSRQSTALIFKKDF